MDLTGTRTRRASFYDPSIGVLLQLTLLLLLFHLHHELIINNDPYCK